MRKILIYIFIFMLLIFAIPFAFTDVIIEETSSINEENLKKIDNGKAEKIKLYHNIDGSIEELTMNQYLYGVVSSEMPASYELEALKAQAVVARTYTIYKIKNGSKHENADICDNSNCCQAWISKSNRLARWDENKREEYWNKIIQAVDTTNKQYITYNGEVINAFFHSNSGGKTELAVNVWGGNLPYLQIVETSGEDGYSAYKSEVVLSKDEFVVKMNENFKDFKIDFSLDNCIKILEYTESGRVKKVKIGNKELSGIDARKIFGLKSSNFSFEIGAFLNISEDHISPAEHPNFNDYLDCKLQFVKNCKNVVINYNTDYFDVVKEAAKNADKIITYGTEKDKDNVDYFYDNVVQKDGAYEFTIHGKDYERRFKTKMFGRFNIENAMVAIILAKYYNVADEDIEKAVKEAEKYAEEDKKRKEEVELRNRAETLVYETEKNLKELENALSEEEKNDIVAAKDALSAALEAGNTEDIKAKTEELTEKFHTISAKMYQQAQAAGMDPNMAGAAGFDPNNMGGAGFDPNAGASAGPAGDNVVDADYEVVDEDK